MQERSLAHNLEIESMLIHPTKWGYRNNKTKNNGNNGNQGNANTKRSDFTALAEWQDHYTA